MNLDISVVSGTFRDITNRIYIFSLLAFLCSGADDPSSAVEVFDVKISGFTVGLLHAGCFLVVAQALLSLVIAQLYFRSSAELRQLADAVAADKSAHPSHPREHLYAAIIANSQRKNLFVRWLFAGFHVAVPMIVGIVACIDAFPQFLEAARAFCFPLPVFGKADSQLANSVILSWR